jgi:hypothetical protein
MNGKPWVSRVGSGGRFARGSRSRFARVSIGDSARLKVSRSSGTAGLRVPVNRMRKATLAIHPYGPLLRGPNIALRRVTCIDSRSDGFWRW